MGRIKNALGKFEVAGELLSFMWERKLWWMIPLTVVLLFFGLIIVFTQGTAIAPFIYALF